MVTQYFLYILYSFRISNYHVENCASVSSKYPMLCSKLPNLWRYRHMWAGFVILGWGLIATLQSTTTTWAGEMACRFFLGAIEAGFGPGCPYLLSFFYLRHELGLRIGIFLSAAPLATCFAGALAYGITSGHSRLANWRLLFLVEGIPTILMAPTAYFFLPDSPEKARFLNEEEKLVAKARGVRQVGEVSRVGGIVWKDITAALLDAKCWFTAVSFWGGGREHIDLVVAHNGIAYVL